MKIVKLSLLLILLAALLLGCAAVTNPETKTNPSIPVPNLQNPSGSSPSGQQALPASVRISGVTEQFVNAADVHLKCNYYDNKPAYRPGSEASFLVSVKNLGAKISYTGDLADHLGTATLTCGDYVLQGQLLAAQETAQAGVLDHSEFLHLTVSFPIDADAPQGDYVFAFEIFDIPVGFSTANPEARYQPCLYDMLDWVRDHNRLEGLDMKEQKRWPVFGDFEDICVLFLDAYSTPMGGSESVNGLVFEYGSSARLWVLTRDGQVLRLADAFENGRITAQQLQEVHDNYLLYRGQFA